MHYRMWIDGKWVDSDEHYEVVCPATGEVVATIARGYPEHVDAAIDAAERSFEYSGWRDTPMAARADLLDELAQRIAARANDLSRRAAKENGTPLRLANGLSVGFPVAHISHFAQLARKHASEYQTPVEADVGGIIRYEPIGVVGGIVPWNFPLLLAVWKTIPAIAAGNSVVLKIDEKTPSGTMILAETLEELGLPAGVLNIVTGDGPSVGGYISAHPRIRKLSFTGSTETGRKVMRSAADNIKKLTLELGGKSANIVLEDADLDLAVDGTLWAFLVHAGQACESGTRLLVHESLHDEFVERLIARASELTIGDPSDPNTDIGPVMNAIQRERIHAYIDAGMDEGACLAFRGKLPTGLPQGGNWVAPVIFTGVNNKMCIGREEIFGPVLSVMVFGDDDEAVALANDSEYGLAAGVWSSDANRALALARRLESGMVWVNDWHNLSGKLPFGGYKQSGFGREMGPAALEEFMQTKAISINYSNRSARTAWDLVIPARSPL